MKQYLRETIKKLLGIPEVVPENAYQMAIERRCKQIAKENLPPQETNSSAEYEAWLGGLIDELRFWYLSIALDGWGWASAYQPRLNLNFPFQFPHFISHFPDGDIRCLEVGTGALATLGKEGMPGKNIITVPTDALANAFRAIFNDFGITPNPPVIECNGENLTRLFQANTFHLSYANNCLDHCYDPIKVIQQMYELTIPTGTVVLGHHINVAVAENYQGLHQWNLCEAEEGKCLIWNKKERHFLNDVLPQGSKINIETYLPHNWINVHITKPTLGFN